MHALLRQLPENEQNNAIRLADELTQEGFSPDHAMNLAVAFALNRHEQPCTKSIIQSEPGGPSP